MKKLIIVLILLVFIIGVMIGMFIPEGEIKLFSIKEKIRTESYLGGLYVKYGESTYKINEPLKELSIFSTFVNVSTPSKMELFDNKLNFIEDYGEQTNLSLSLPKGKYYFKATYIAYFEGFNASETKYFWVLFESNPDIIPNSSDMESFQINLDRVPAIWEEEPTIKW